MLLKKICTDNFKKCKKIGYWFKNIIRKKVFVFPIKFVYNHRKNGRITILVPIYW